jgi:hypothetical protein
MVFKKLISDVLSGKKSVPDGVSLRHQLSEHKKLCNSASELKRLIAPRISQSSNPFEIFHISEHNEGRRRNDCDK